MENQDQILNDLKTAKSKVVNADGSRIISAMDILLTLSTVNSHSFDIVVKHIEYNKRTFNTRKWLDLCDKAGI